MSNTKKIMLVGEQKVGKTSILSYLLRNQQFPNQHYPSTGVQLGIKIFQFANHEFSSIQFWDTAGKHELHQYISQKYYDGMDGFIIVIDLGNQNTLKSVNYWSEKIRRVRGSDQGYLIGILANKSDLANQEFTVQKILKEYPKIKFYGKVSLKTRSEEGVKSNLQLAFEEISKDLYHDDLPRIQIIPQTSQNKSNCECSLM